MTGTYYTDSLRISSVTSNVIPVTSWLLVYLKTNTICLCFHYSFNSGEYTLAAELYREVLRSSEEHKEKLKTDSLQVSEH